MIEVILYSREGCHLCEQVKQELDAIQAEIPHRLNIIDIESDIKLLKLYGFSIPVVKVGPYQLSAPITRQDLIITLRAAQQREEQIVQVEASIEKKNQQLQLSWTSADQFSDWIARHYLGIFNLFIGVYLGISFLAPVLMKVGATTPASWIYRVYGAMCHELAFRSYFLFGEQAAYPREIAGVDGLLTYSEATGLDGNDLWGARDFIGNEYIGYKIALCQRDIAIYAGLLVFGGIFSIFRRRIKSLHWIAWLVIGVIPIGIDGLSQLLGQISFVSFFTVRESTPFLRTLTGLLFGFSTAWFGYPLVEETMSDTRSYLESKRKRLDTQHVPDQVLEK